MYISKLLMEKILNIYIYNEYLFNIALIYIKADLFKFIINSI